MVDIAELAFSVDTSDIKKAEQSLDSLERSSKKAGAGLTQSFAQATNSSRGLTSAFANIDSRTIREASQALDSMGGEASSAQVAVAKYKAEIDETRAALARQEMALSQSQAALQRYEAELDDVRRALAQANERAERSGGAFGRVSASMRGAGGAAVGFGTSIAGASLALVGAGASIALATNNLLALNKELQNAEAQLGVSSESLQIWGLAAEKVGLSSEKMRDIFKDTADKLGDFATTGGGEAADIIERLNLNIDELANKSPDKALLDIANALETVDNISQNDKIFLLESLADEASALLPILKDNASALDELRQKAQQRGLLITPEEEAILNRANDQMADMRMAFAGVSQEAGLLGAELINMFGPAFTEILDSSIAWFRQFRDDVKQIVQVWSDSFSAMGAENQQFMSEFGAVVDWISDRFRQGITYFPVLATGVFTAIQAYGESWGHSLAALLIDVQAWFRNAFSIALDVAGTVFGGMTGAAGKAIGFIIDRLADMVGAFSGLANIEIFGEKLLGDVGESINNIENRMRSMASSSKQAGDSIKSSFAGQAQAMRESAAQSELNAQLHRAGAAAAKVAAQAALESAAATVKSGEAQRAITAQIREENHELGGLAETKKQAREQTTSYAKAQESAKTATKQHTEAAKEAAKAAAELAREQERIAGLFADARNRVAMLNKHLLAGADAARVLEMQQDGLNKTQAQELQQLEAQAKALEKQIQQREESAKAVADAQKARRDAAQALKLSAQAINYNDEQLRALTLTHTKGYNPALAKTQAAIEAEIKRNEQLRASRIAAQKALESSVQSLTIAERGLRMNDEQLRALTLTIDKGYSPAIAKAIAANEAKAKALQETRKQLLENAKAVDDAAKKVQFLEQHINASAEAFRAAELVNNGYTATQASALAADESRIQSLMDLRKAQQDASESIRQAQEANRLLKIELEQGAEAAKRAELKSKKYSAAQIDEKIKADALTESYRDQIQIRQRVSEEIKQLEQAQALQNIRLTEGADAAEAAALVLDGYSKEQAKAAVETQKAMEFQAQFYDTLVDSIKNAESVKDVFKGIGDFLKNWLKDQIAHFAANKIMLSLGLNKPGGGFSLGNLFGGGGSSGDGFSLGNLFGGGGSGGGILSSIGSGLGSIGSFISSGFSSLMGSLGGVGSAISGVVGSIGSTLGSIGSSISGALGGITSSLGGLGAALGPIGAVAGILSLGFGKKKVHRTGVELGYSDAGGFSGQEYTEFKRKKWFKNRKWTEYSELDSAAAGAIEGYLDNMNNTLLGQVDAMGVRGAERILRGFSVATEKFHGEDIEGQIEGWLGSTTEAAYSHAFKRLPYALKQAIDPAYQDMKLLSDGTYKLYATSLSAEQLAQRFQHVGQVADIVKPTLEALGFNLRGLGQSTAGMAANAAALTDSLGGIEPAMQQLSFYAEHFAPVGVLAAKALREAQGSLNDWNQSIGRSGEAAIDTSDELYDYMQSLNLTSEAGREAAAAAFEQMQALLAVEAANQIVTTAVEQLGLTLDLTSPKAQEAIASLVELGGGLDGLAQTLDSYYANFYSEQERQQFALEQARASLQGWNDTLGLADGSVINSRETFRSYVESLDLTTQAGREAAAAAFEQIEALLAVAQANEQAALNFNAVSDAARNLNLNFDATSPAASEAANALIQLMGGLDAFTAATQNYYQQFYSQEEQQQLALANAASAVSAFNDSLGLTGQAAIDTAAEFRNYVESLDLTTEEGRQAFAAAMELSESMAAVAESGLTLNELIDSLPKNLQSAFELMSASSMSTAETVEAGAEAVRSAAGVIGDATGIASGELNNLGTAISSVAGAAASAAQTAANAAQAAANAANSATTASRSASRAANDATYSAQQAARNLGADTVTDAVNTLPRFALGGITSGLSLAGEAGPEAVVPLPDGRSIPVSINQSELLQQPAGYAGANDPANAVVIELQSVKAELVRTRQELRDIRDDQREIGSASIQQREKQRQEQQRTNRTLSDAEQRQRISSRLESVA